MKKRIYFMISSIIQIIASLYAIIKVNDIIKSLLDSASMYPEAMQERILKLYQNSGATIIIVMAIVCIIFNIFILYFAYNNKLSENGKTIITLSILSILTANIVINELMAVVNIIVIATEKKEDKVVKEKQEIPNLKQEKVDTLKIVKAIGLLLIYFSQMIWKKLLPDNMLGAIIPIVFYLIMITFCIWFFFCLLKDNAIAFKKHFRAYISFIFTRIGIFYLIFIIISIICIMVTRSFAANQDAIEALPLWLSLPLAVIYAPIVEEILFRGCFRRLIKNNTIFIIISGIIFGLLHTISTETVLLNMIVLAIPYGLMGSFMAYMYVKTNNIFSNMSCHFFFNLLGMIVSILINGI